MHINYVSLGVIKLFITTRCLSAVIKLLFDYQKKEAMRINTSASFWLLNCIYTTELTKMNKPFSQEDQRSIQFVETTSCTWFRFGFGSVVMNSKFHFYLTTCVVPCVSIVPVLTLAFWLKSRILWLRSVNQRKHLLMSIPWSCGEK